MKVNIMLEYFGSVDNSSEFRRSKEKALKEKRFSIRYFEGDLFHQIVEALKAKNIKVSTVIRELMLVIYGLEVIVDEPDNSELIDLNKLRIVQNISVNELRRLIDKIEQSYQLNNQDSHLKRNESNSHPSTPKETPQNESPQEQVNPRRRGFSGAQFLPR